MFRNTLGVSLAIYPRKGNPGHNFLYLGQSLHVVFYFNNFMIVVVGMDWKLHV